MYVEILQENLNSSLQVINRFVSSRPSLPILSNVVFEANSNKLKLKAANMETFVSIEIPVKVNDEGVLAIPSKLLTEYIKLLPPGKVDLKSEKESLTIKRDDSVATLAGSDAQSFPKTPELVYTTTVTLSTKIISQIVKFVSFSASIEESRPILSAILLHTDSSGKADIVSTDGYRLSLLPQVSIDEKLVDTKLLIPAKIFNEVERLAKEVSVESIDVGFSSDEKSLLFTIGSIQIIARLVDGEFPKYEKILPQNEPLVTVIANRRDLIDSIKASSLFARNNSNIITWDIKDKELSIVAKANQVGSQQSSVLIETMGNEEVSVSFNSKYVIDILSHLDVDKVKVDIYGSLSPVVFSVENSDFLHVIMPVRTNS